MVGGQRSDRRLAIGFAVSLVLTLVAMLATFAPNEAFPVATGFDGFPRLALYLAAGIVLAATASAASDRNGLLRSAPSNANRGDRRLVTCLALALVLSAVNGVRLDRDIRAGGGPLLWILALALVAAAVVSSPRRTWTWPTSRIGRPSPFALAVAAIVLVALLARMISLSRVPVNVQADEGDRAASALDVLDGIASASWFDSGWFYVNMVYFRVLATFFDAFGVGVVQGRLLNAVAGLVLFGAVAWIAFRQFERRIALVAVALAAVSPIALQFSRTIAESGVGAALFALSLAGFLEGGRTGRAWPYAVAGTAGGLSLYTYASARSWPIAAAGTVVILILFRRSSWRSILRGAAVAATAAVVAVTPFAAHIHAHSDELRLRFEQTSVLSAENRRRLPFTRPDMAIIEVMALQVERSLGVFDRYGDGSDFLPSGRPLFPRLLAALTLLGVFYATARGTRDPRLAIIALWFWLGLSGMVLTVETPAAQRAATLVVTLPLIAAVALWELASRVPSTIRYARSRWGDPDVGQSVSSRRLGRMVGGMVALLVVGLMAVQAWAYFVDYGAREGPWSSATLEARQIAQLGTSGPVYALESSQHMVKSGWVRFIARRARTGSVSNPGSQLPVIAPDEPYPDLTWRQRVPLPGPGQTMNFVLYGSEQLPYVSLLRDLYGTGVVQPLRRGRSVFAVPPDAPSRATGVALSIDGRPAGVVAAFGRLPSKAPVPAAVRWTSGIRIARAGLHRMELVAPVGYRVLLDDVEVVAGRGIEPSAAIVRVPAGLHFLEMRGGVRSRSDHVLLRWSGRLSSPTSVGRARDLRPAQTYPAMTSPWGLLSDVVETGASSGSTSLSWPALMTTVASGFVNLPGHGQITWRGVLLVPRSGTYRMALVSDGSARLTLDGRPVSPLALKRAMQKGMDMSRGRHSVRITIPIAAHLPTYARWQWIPPRSDGSANTSGAWSIVPPSALRPVDAVSMVARSG